MRDTLSKFLSNPVVTVRVLPVEDMEQLRSENERLTLELQRMKTSYSETVNTMLYYADLLRENHISFR